MKIVADNKIPFLPGVFAPYAEEVFLPGKAIGRSDVADADALIVRTRTRCDAALLARSKVKFVATATIGFDHIASAELAELGIGWTSAPGCNAASVAQYFCSAVVNCGVPYAGRTVGIVGVGHVGKLIARAAAALGMRVLLNDPPRAEAEGGEKFVSLDTVCREADFVTLHVPLERGGAHPTFHLFDAARFAALKPGAVFMNASRGEAVDTGALKLALQSGKLAASVIDVWENEPGIDREVLKLTTFTTPHIAGYSTDGKANGTGMSVRATARALGIAELFDWRVTTVPAPAEPEIELAPALSESEQIRFAINCSYNIAEDTARLRSEPETFESQRGNYPLRREFFAYRVRGGTPGARQVLGALGFELDRR